MCHTISDGLAVEEADVIEGGRSDDEALLAVPDNVPLVWAKAKAEELWEDRDRDNPAECSVSKGIKKDYSISQLVLPSSFYFRRDNAH